MKAKTIFVTIQFEKVDKIFDYPQNIRLPRKGETVIYENLSGIVSDIRHIISGDLIETKIICTKII